jgi:hypothetical protein
VLTEAEEKGAPVILYHEPKDPVVYVRRSGGKFESEPV